MRGRQEFWLDGRLPTGCPLSDYLLVDAAIINSLRRIGLDVAGLFSQLLRRRDLLDMVRTQDNIVGVL